jgi:arsenite methyltransferase
MEREEIRKNVRERYGKIARESGQGCCGGSGEAGPCCGSDAVSARSLGQKIGYGEEELSGAPEGANLGLGCGNPVALASLKPGEVVLDLGSGAGFDCFLAASRVGASGRVIGVDMTPDMLDRARENARSGGYTNVEFRLGEIENLPAADASVDAVISNCVINLSTDKRRVFEEAFRVLRPGGRLMVSDIVLLKELPEFVKESVAAYVGCIAGAVEKNEYLAAVKAAGFEAVKVVNESVFPLDCIVSDPTAKVVLDELELNAEQVRDIAASIVSANVQARKPGK